MKLAVKLMLMVSAVIIMLTLALNGGEQQVAVNANPFKINHQQYERVQKPALAVTHKANLVGADSRK
ncbi:hypothetical protein [Paenibacillus agricola]|uniref:Uncharacterized protein n=1 Tax=Paenibacillus agricola TaxID=2716264 RepID=A0ABX0IZV3_9BACL|nr:hypothetical protein [Paenibacillus agricola]NHN29091.1 hypothetical protein [Paenibacillus agricola]